MLQRFQDPHVRQADRRTIRLDRIQKLKTELWPLVTASGLIGAALSAMLTPPPLSMRPIDIIS
jgi:hypothetical protein